MNNTVSKPKRWFFPVLFISLALNVLIAGMFLGWLASPDGPKRREFEGARGIVGEPFLRALPASERRAFMRDVLREAPRIRESRESLRARFESFLVALRADPYDPDAVAALLAEQRNVALKRQDIGERLLLKRLEEMSPEQRDAYAEALERALRRLRQPRD